MNSKKYQYFKIYTYKNVVFNKGFSVMLSKPDGFNKKKWTKRQNFDFSTFVTRPGFEPRQAESESAVLPLYYRAIK
jgi:hypothetical protein